MPHAELPGPLAKRQKLSVAQTQASAGSALDASRIFAPFRTIGLVSSTSVPFASTPLGKAAYQITTSIGRSLQTYGVRHGLNLIFVTGPQTPSDITATSAWKQKVIAAWGGIKETEPQGIWIFKRGKKVEELTPPSDLSEPIKQILVFGSWIVASALTRIEVFKSDSLEHYTTIHTMAATKRGNEITGGIVSMPTFLNKIFVGRKDGWVELWNISTGKLIYTILPPPSASGPVTCLEATPALSLLAVAYSSGSLVITNVVTDKRVLELDAGTPESPVSCISFRTDGTGAGSDGRKDGVMATATPASGDVTFWDLNDGGRVTGVLRGAHNPPSQSGSNVCGGISNIEFLVGQPVIVTSGRDNALKSWIFDASPFSSLPHLLHGRSGHSGSINCLQFLPSDFDGAEAGTKWLLSGGRDRSLWGWSLRRDGLSTELSQGNMRKKAKKIGILSANALAGGSTVSLEDIKAPEITCIASSLNRDGGIGALPGKQPTWQKLRKRAGPLDAEISASTGWESVVTAHKADAFARTWFWGRKRAGRWALPTGDGANVSTVAISPCGTFALVGSERGGLDMYNLQSGMHRQRFPSQLTASQARQVRLQQLQQADDVAQLNSGAAKNFLPGMGRHTSSVTGIVVDSLNRLVVTCSLDGTVKFWDFLSGTLLDQLDWNASTAAAACRYHAPSSLLAFACENHAIRIVDMETKRKIRELKGAHGCINDFCFSNDGRWLIAASQDNMIRTWDLPTGHLIDVFMLEKSCTALSMSSNGQYLAASIDGQPGVALWTNKSLFKHVTIRQMSEPTIDRPMSIPTTSGESNQGLLAAAFEPSAPKEEEDDTVVPPTIDQLSSDMTTLSLVPKSRWQTLLHLDLIKERNKPQEPPQAPAKAPFFLTAGNNANGGVPDNLPQPETERRSRITKLERGRSEEAFSSKLRTAAAINEYDDFIEHLKSLSPSSADLELRSLSVGEGHVSNELLHFIQALTARLKARRDYEMTQAWMTIFLRLHSDVVMANETTMAALKEWRTHQKQECDRLSNLVGYCSGVVGFLRSPRA